MADALAGSNLHTRIALAALGLAALAATAYGWHLFWFLTDDAYIAFRYVDNSIAGHGYVWNSPPFRPVEGYTSFLWIAVLEVVWRLCGIEPPAAANWLSLLLTCGTLALVAAMVLRGSLAGAWGPGRLGALALVFLGTVSNRTFLTWSSSGLETALFVFLLHLWIYAALYLRAGGAAWPWAVSATAALCYLCRPDGMLIALATLALAAALLLYRERAADRGFLLALAPLLAVPAHFAWRKACYGEWLPNTYYAKHVAAWPESGWRYIGSFVLEYALWLWLLVALAWLALRGLRQVRARPLPDRSALFAAVVVLTLLGHLGYYTLNIGGDHFEYRVYSHLVPLAFVSLLWLVDRLRLKPPYAAALMLGQIALSWPLPWAHWHASKDLNTREATHAMVVPVADYLPGWARWYGERFDAWQAWLIEHRVCMRHQEHKIFLENQKIYLPEREAIARQFADNAAAIGPFPVIAYGSVGLLGWRMAPINVIDTAGLNDYVVARNPIPPHQDRMMAHDRLAPAGYAECFEPNVEPRVSFDYDEHGRQATNMRRYVRIAPRNEALTAQRIRDCETRAWY